MIEQSRNITRKQKDSGAPHKHSVLVVTATGAATPYYHAFRNFLKGESVGKASIDDVREQIGLHNAEIVLLDCEAHVSAGLRTLEIIKKAYPRVSVFFLTQLGSEETAVKAFRAGARDYLTMPVIVVQFVAAVRDLLQVRRSSWEQRSPFLQSYVQKLAMPAGVAPAEYPDGVVRAVDYIERNLSRAISLKQLADAAGLSRFHFCRMFRDCTGINPMVYISNSRVEVAKEMLKRRGIPICTVADTAGFEHVSTFNRQFKKQTGKSPSEYRLSSQTLSASPPDSAEDSKVHLLHKILHK